MSYYNLFQSEPDVLALLTSEEKDDLKESIRHGIWEKIYREEKAGVKAAPVRYWRIGLSVAAAAAVILFAFRMFLWNTPSSIHKQESNLAFIRNGNHVISLPDGSTVTLGQNSRLNYSQSFGSAAIREVFLEGQAFFDVRRDSVRPFVVRAGKVNVTVLGTAFNVKAFSADGDITVTVQKGKVRVSDPVKTLGVITPHQQIVYNKQNEYSIKQSVNTDSCLEWRKLDCLFDNLTLSEMTALLEERFKVKIIISDQVRSTDRFTATFPQSEGLEQALKSICEFNDVTYVFDKAKATVLIRKK